jgi:hypothetical protein
MNSEVCACDVLEAKNADHPKQRVSFEIISGLRICPRNAHTEAI